MFLQIFIYKKKEKKYMQDVKKKKEKNMLKYRKDFSLQCDKKT